VGSASFKTNRKFIFDQNWWLFYFKKSRPGTPYSGPIKSYKCTVNTLLKAKNVLQQSNKWRQNGKMENEILRDLEVDRQTQMKLAKLLCWRHFLGGSQLLYKIWPPYIFFSNNKLHIILKHMNWEICKYFKREYSFCGYKWLGKTRLCVKKVTCGNLPSHCFPQL